MNLRRAQLAKIHIAAKELGLIKNGDKSGYQDMLFTVTRKRSAADLDSHQLGQVLDHLKGRGWKPRRGGAPRRSDAQARLIRSLWLNLRDNGVLRDASETALRTWCEKQLKLAGFEDVVRPIELLGDGEKHELIERLKKWVIRAVPKGRRHDVAS